MQSILQLLEHNVLIAGFIITIMRGPELVATVNPALYVGSAGNLLGFQPGRELGGGLYSDATVLAEQLTIHGLLHPIAVKESVLDTEHQPEVQVDKSVCRYAALGHLLTANAAPGMPQVLAMREGMMLSLLMTCRQQKKKGEPELTQIDHQAAPNHKKSVSKQLQVRRLRHIVCASGLTCARARRPSFSATRASASARRRGWPGWRRWR